MEVYFEIMPDQDSKTLKVDTIVNIHGAPIPVPGVKRDFCQGVVKCPVKKGQKVSGVYKIPTPSYTPLVTSSIKVHVKADTGADALCIMVPFKVWP